MFERLRRGDRGQVTGIIRVGIFFLSTLFLFWVFAMVAPAVIEPLHDFAVDWPAASEDTDTLDRYQAITLEFAPVLLLLGIVFVVFVYAAWRERFSGPRRPP